MDESCCGWGSRPMNIQPSAEFVPRYAHHRPPPMSAPKTIAGQRAIRHHAVCRRTAHAKLALDLGGLQQAVVPSGSIFHRHASFIHPHHDLLPCHPVGARPPRRHPHSTGTPETLPPPPCSRFFRETSLTTAPHDLPWRMRSTMPPTRISVDGFICVWFCHLGYRPFQNKFLSLGSPSP
jgi:hypothetical protein